MTYVYVASSWRNPIQPEVCAALAAAGIEHYDFKHPPGGTGFSWKQVKEPVRVSHAFVPYRANPGICSICAAVRPLPCRQLPAEVPSVASIAAKSADWEQVDEYLRMVNHPVAVAGFESDFDAMKRADTFVLALPCGKSAHLELGWAAGAGKRTAILLEDPVEPELMYWWTISGEALLDALRRTADGESPGVVYAELYANSDIERPSDDGAAE